jgi:SAM-dependent methyltransferase
MYTALHFGGRVPSTNYIPLKTDEARVEGVRLRGAWLSQSLPILQRDIAEKELSKFRRGDEVVVFKVFINALASIKDCSRDMELLEIGCSSGYYSEVIEFAKLPFKYYGCDYSPAFIELAKNKYPQINFHVEDAISLSYSDQSFDVVVSGCCLLHIPEYLKAIEETVRVSRRYVIFHRTPVVWGKSEQWYRKDAYGVETIEIHFNENEFTNFLEKSKLKILSIITLHESSENSCPSTGSAMRTYVCEKMNFPIDYYAPA